MEELEAICSAFTVAQAQIPLRLADCARDKAEFLKFFLAKFFKLCCPDTLSCVSAYSTRITALLFSAVVLWCLGIFCASNYWTSANGCRSDSRSVRLVWHGREREVEGKRQEQGLQGKGKGEKGDKSKDQKPISKPEQLHAAVMEVDDVVMRAGDDETSTGWCFAVTGLCAVVGSTVSLLPDSGSDEHLCTPKFADLIPTSPDRSPSSSRMCNGMGPTGGKHAMEATATFPAAEVRDNILSLGKLRRKGFSFNFCPCGCSMEKDGKRVPLYLERNSLRVEAHLLERAPTPGCVEAGTADTEELMDGVDITESHASWSADPAVETSAEAGTTPAPVLKTWSSIKELHSRLRELGAPIHGTQDVLFRRLCEYEQIAARKKEVETRRKELAVAAEPVTPKILPGPTQPSEVERQHHMVNHLPPAPWCELCVMGRGKDDPHLRSHLREKREQLLVIAFDVAFVKTTSASGETGQKYATTLVAVNADLFFVKVILLVGKETTDYSATGLIKFIECFFHLHVRLRCDGEPATVALANKVKTWLATW